MSQRNWPLNPSSHELEDGAGGTVSAPVPFISDRNRRRSTTGTILQTAESIKERQAKARENRETRRRSLQQPHKYIMSIVADHLGLDLSNVEEFVLDADRNIQHFNSFINKDGTRSLKFYYQETKTPGIEECGRTIHGASKGAMTLRLRVTSGGGEKLAGVCVYFLKAKMDVTLSEKNMHEEILFGFFNVQSKDGILSTFEEVFSRIYQSCLQNLQNWGVLMNSPSGRKTKKSFVDNFDNFVNYLRSAQAYAREGIMLEESTSEKVLLNEPTMNISQCIQLASNPDVVADMEVLATKWCRQIEQILAESDQMRKEADDTGPFAELDHWRQLMARFNALLDQIKSHKCRTVINIIHIAKSKVMKKWKELDKRITDSANEAKDNVKYLYTLEKYCEPLYRCDPVSMTDCLPGLINAIKMIHSISRYYNTSERMTSLFIKVTNQMVTACKNYITEDGVMRVWDLPRQPLIEKLRNCVNLYKNYHEIFHKTKEKIESTPGERPFDFSEMYIFGKFETFCRRLEKIITLLNYIEEFSVVAESKIEGLENFSARFQQIFASIRKKPYDVLDQRKVDFEIDFEDFRRQLTELEEGIQNFMDNCFKKVTLTMQSLQLLQKFEHLNIPHLSIDEKYASIFEHFGEEVEEIRKLYQKHKDDPPIPRNMPPVTGKIAWVRQLTQRIQDPMEIFMLHADCMKGEDSKRIIRNYNRVAKALMEYEVLYHYAWVKSVEMASSNLQVPVLVRHPHNPDHLLVNFDPYIFEVIKEAEYMLKLELDIPESAKILIYSSEQLHNYHSQMDLLLDENKTLRAEIPPIFHTLLGPSLRKTDNSIRPGLFAHTWTSLSLPGYFREVKRALNELRIVVKQVNDIKSTRIDNVLQDLSETLLCDLPERTPWTVPEFQKNMEVYCERTAVEINRMSEVVEDAVKELIKIFLYRAQISPIQTEQQEENFSCQSPTSKPEEILASGTVEGHLADAAPENGVESEAQVIWEACEELFEHFKHRLIESLLRATRYSLDAMRKRFSFR
ncbi:hypothetical protein CHS0354_012173 [Potamilus streckersoni]|uniref:Dynein heavy chain tail domain-containing protein n=1 Tax=Potamilus streckersoni TaxID=2493646 RepID=A0AAE0SA28_9BIVA|nr:hypothetical protein CHS0354_012173 [Potamilus streckersoni]